DARGIHEAPASRRAGRLADLLTSASRSAEPGRDTTDRRVPQEYGTDQQAARDGPVHSVRSTAQTAHDQDQPTDPGCCTKELSASQSAGAEHLERCLLPADELAEHSSDHTGQCTERARNEDAEQRTLVRFRHQYDRADEPDKE